MRFRLILPTLIYFASPLFAAEPTQEQVDHFEQKVRPILVEHCYSCHSEKSKKPKAGLRVDGRKHLLAGGDNGMSIVPGDAEKSLIIQAIRYKNIDLQMPPKAKLSDSAIRDLEQWVKAGAPWPNDESSIEKKSDFDLQKRMREHWAWKPILRPALPNQKADDAVDAFILEKLQAKNLKPAAPAEKLIWLRRVTFALIGLPPKPEEIASFIADDTPLSHEKVVDRLLASPHFGERWARHWLDLVRFAESRGHEFEPDIPNAYQYRDYVVRAFNVDLPYNQFVHEHLAGDLLKQPRVNAEGTNESLIGAGFWHLGEEVHSPVDIRQDQADRLDNRIDVLGKAFLGLTVACARCHDHKFDAITTKDYYALFGMLEGSNFRLARPDGWATNRAVAQQLAELRAKTHAEFLKATKWEVAKPEANVAFDTWQKTAIPLLDFSGAANAFLPDDVTYSTAPRAAGTLGIRMKAGQPVLHAEEYPAAVFDGFWQKLKLAPGSAKDTQALGRMNRAGFSIRTPTTTITKKNLYYLVRGGGMAFACVNGHTILAGPLHGKLLQNLPNSETYRWVRHDVTGYLGQRVDVEFTADPKTDFAIAGVWQSDDAPPPLPTAHAKIATPPDAKTLAAIAEKLASAEQELAAKVQWESRAVLTLWDGPGIDGKVFIRGNPRTEGEVVPRRSLEALAGADRIPHPSGTGRLELAMQFTDAKQNPFISRVVVNRIWHHLFGRGIVATTDNFGVLGEAPTHPELLDYLADEFVQNGWSFKKMIRRLVLTSTYRMSSESDAASDTADPTNALWHKFPIMRLEGEAIRDAILSVSGRLDAKLGGPSVPIHLTAFLDGRGRPGSGPIDGNGRRSIYLGVRRNFLSPFLLAFDTPIPFSTIGRRQVSNVPAQALILLNDPFVHQMSEVWAKALLAKPGSTDDRVKQM